MDEVESAVRTPLYFAPKRRLKKMFKQSGMPADFYGTFAEVDVSLLHITSTDIPGGHAVIARLKGHQIGEVPQYRRSDAIKRLRIYGRGEMATTKAYAVRYSPAEREAKISEKWPEWGFEAIV
ncbi:hypothetical protein I6E29_03660 [Arcanobacterium haemolyticum]|nr:hypothetical protein [Arcanobacterium haemolyticum]